MTERGKRIVMLGDEIKAIIDPGRFIAATPSDVERDEEWSRITLENMGGPPDIVYVDQSVEEVFLQLAKVYDR